MQFEILFGLSPISIVFWVFCIGFIVLLAFVLYIYRYGGIGTAVQYYEKGGTMHIYRAKETEKSVTFGDKTFSKVVLKMDAEGHILIDEETNEPVPELDSAGKYQMVARPAVMWRRFKPYRVFYCQEGYPTILDWDRRVPVTDVTATDLNALSEGAFATGLAKHLLKSADVSFYMWLFVFLFGLVFGLFVYPLVIP